MSVATANIRNTQVICSPSHQAKLANTQTHVDYSASKKVVKDENSSPSIKNEYADSSSNVNQSQNGSNGGSNQHSSQNHADMEYTQSVTTTSTTGMCPAVNGTMTGTYANMNGSHVGMNGLTNGYQQQYSGSNATINGLTQNNLDPTGPLPNEIFELLNEFWRPNDLVNLDGHAINGKMSRRSPDGSLEGTPEEEKDGEDDISSIADTEMGVDRNTQKRRYSRLSDGYERLKSVLPSVKDKRRVSKARILDEAINYIQRLESITNVLKREHEKRLSMLNGSNGFFPDYTVQPYMRSLFQKQMYPPGLSSTKMNQYPKMSTTPSAMPKSPRIKQYSQQYSSQSPGMGVGANMNGTDYNYNNINSYSGTTSMYPSSDPGQIMNGDASPITNNSPYSACSLSPGSTSSTYQNNSVVNNSWPYQGGSMTGYDGSTSQLSSYSQGRQNSSSAYGNTSYSNLNGNMWGSMGGMNEASSQVLPHAEHSMKVG